MVIPPSEPVPVSYPETGETVHGVDIFAVKLLDSFGNPLANTEIKIVELGILTITDDEGFAIFRNIPVGKYNILGVIEGQEFSQEVEVSPENKVITVVIQTDPNILTYAFAGIAMLAVALFVGSAIYIFYLKRKSHGTK